MDHDACQVAILLVGFGLNNLPFIPLYMWTCDCLVHRYLLRYLHTARPLPSYMLDEPSNVSRVEYLEMSLSQCWLRRNLVVKAATDATANAREAGARATKAPAEADAAPLPEASPAAGLQSILRGLMHAPHLCSVTVALAFGHLFLEDRL